MGYYAWGEVDVGKMERRRSARGWPVGLIRLCVGGKGNCSQSLKSIDYWLNYWACDATLDGKMGRWEDERATSLPANDREIALWAVDRGGWIQSRVPEHRAVCSLRG